ncbi:hypothetical protein KDL44_13585 [bacterium]|nr:hypothetical protein [bacterium]
MSDLERNERSDGLAGERRDERGEMSAEIPGSGGMEVVNTPLLPIEINLYDRPGLISDQRAAQVSHQILSYLQSRSPELLKLRWPLGSTEPKRQQIGYWHMQIPDWCKELLTELREVDFDALLAVPSQQLHFELDRTHERGRIGLSHIWQVQDKHARVLMQCVMSLNPAGQSRLPGLTWNLNLLSIVSTVLLVLTILVFSSISSLGIVWLLPIVIAVLATTNITSLQGDSVTPRAILALYLAFTEYYLKRELPWIVSAQAAERQDLDQDGVTFSTLQGDPRSIDKHHYENADLDRIDSRMLQQRLYRIDNPLAREIAEDLFSRLRRTFRSVDFLSTDPKYRPSLRMLCGNEANGLLRQLRRMQEQRLSGLIMEGPEFVERILANLHPLQRLLWPPPRPESSKQLSRILVEYVEFIGNEKRRFSWRFGTILNVVLTLISALLLLYVSTDFMRWILFLLFGPAFMFLMWGVHAFNQNAEQRLLALYISFTDELVQHELEQHPEEAEDAG